MSFQHQTLLTIAIVLLMHVACRGQEADESKSSHATIKPFRVMSFNIRYGTADDGDNHWDKRKQLVVETIEGFGPDLLGTQETWPFQAQYLQKELKRYGYVGKLREPDQDGGEQCGLFFRLDRFEDLEQGHFNCGEGSEPYRNLVTDNRTKVPLVDALRRIQPTAQSGEGTFNGFAGRDSGARIDWILVSPEFRVKSAEIVKHQRGGRYPSDHFPVTAVLGLR